MPSIDGTNYPGPWEMRIFYTCVAGGNTYSHVSRHNLDVDTPPDAGSDLEDYDLISRQGLFYNGLSWANGLVGQMVAQLNENSSVDRVELWKYETGTYNAAFQTVQALNAAGTSVSDAVELSQTIWSFRTQNGGHAYFEILDSIHVPGIKQAREATAAGTQAVFDVITNLNSPMIGRDGGYCFAPLWWLPGTSEHSFKKKYRDF